MSRTQTNFTSAAMISRATQEAVTAVEETPPAPVETDVPSGSSSVVLGWVGTSARRAARALAAEQARETPRKTLVARLSEIIG